MHPFALIWRILSKGQFNRGKDNNKLLIGTSKTGDHGCLTEVTAKYRSDLQLTPVRDYNNNRYGVEERARKQAPPFIENKTAQTEPVHYRLNNNN